MSGDCRMSLSHIRLTEQINNFTNTLADTDCVSASYRLKGACCDNCIICAWSFLKTQTVTLSGDEKISVLHLMVLLGSGYAMRSTDNPREFLDAFEEWNRLEDVRSANLHSGFPGREHSITSLIGRKLSIKLSIQFITYD